MNQVRIGIVGCGSINTRSHIPDLLTGSTGKITAFCDTVVARAEALAKQHGGKAYQEFEALLRDPEVDAVVLGVPNALHAPMTIAALRAGKHVMVEKPMALTRDEAKAMIATAKETGKKLMVGQSQRYMPPHRKAQEILKSGRLGKVLTFRSSFLHGGPESWSIDNSPETWFFKKSLAGMGVCGDLAIHKADIMRVLLGEEITEVSATIETRHKTYSNGKLIDVDDNAQLLVKTQSGITGVIIVSWTGYGDSEGNSTILHCEKGALMLAADPVYGVIVRYRNGEEEKFKVGAISTNTHRVRGQVMDKFTDAILNNREPDITGEDAYRSLNVILTAFEAAAAKRVLPVPI